MDRVRQEDERELRVSVARRVVTLVAVALAGCVTAPPPEPAPLPPPALVVTLPEPLCPACMDQSAEISRLRQDLASRESELRDLRSSQRDQVKVIQESKSEVTRAKAKLRRLATQADAASYIAEVEVALKALRSSLPATPATPMLSLAQGFLESSAAPFAQGDYGTAMDRAAQAEQLLIVVADNQAANGARARVPGEVPLHVTIPVKALADSHLRREPLPKAPVLTVLKKDSPLVAHAYKGAWMRVETEDGKSGWITQAQLAAR